MKRLKITIVVIVCLILSSFKQNDERILFVGDSLTCYSGGWQHQVAKVRNTKYDNISKGGKRTKWMLEQMKKYPKGSYKYTDVIIYGGINDSFSSVSETETINNIQQMVDIAKAMGAVPIVIIGYNPQRVNVNTIYSNQIETKCRNRYIKLQKRIQSELKRCVIIPMETTIDRTDSDDGVHLKSSGHRKFSKWVLSNM